MMPTKSVAFFLSLFMVLVACHIAGAQQVLVPTFTQQLVITPASASSDTQVKLDILPVYDGKTWAFTARWDDNNANHLNMQKAMASLGLKGTFYLNASSGDTAADYAKQLSTEGCSIGGHTMRHYWLTTLNPNAMFAEILLNRIEREAQTDIPINSFAFPFGNYNDGKDPSALENITLALVRSGYHHCVYSRFVRDNRYIPENLFSTVNQVVPGDRQINAEKFNQAVKRILDDPSASQKTDYAISLGVHAWQSPEELEKFKTLLANYAHRDDFWYCNETEFAAYRLQAKHTQITEADGKSGSYHVTRPTIQVAGNDVPLTIAITGSKPVSVILDGQKLDVRAGDKDQWLVNLPYPATQQMPARIDWLAMTDHASGPLKSPEFPGLSFRFGRYQTGDWYVFVSNSSDEPLAQLTMQMRLSVCYDMPMQVVELEPIASGAVFTQVFKLGAVRADPAYVGGKSVAAAEVNFIHQGKAGRVYITQEDTGPSVYTDMDARSIRDRACVMGPMDAQGFDFARFLPQSVKQASLKPLSDSPLEQWQKADESVAEMFAYDRVYPYSRDAQWRNAAKVFDRKPAVVVVAVDVLMPQADNLVITSGLPVLHFAIDGQVTKLDQQKTVDKLSSGEHRVLMVLDTKGWMAFNKYKPALLKLAAGDVPVTYLPIP